MNIPTIKETPIVDDEPQTTAPTDPISDTKEDQKEQPKDETPLLKDTSTAPVVVVEEKTINNTEKETPTSSLSLVLKDASTDAELYELENDDRIVSIRKLDDVVRESKMVLPEEVISNDWLVLNLVVREIPTF